MSLDLNPSTILLLMDLDTGRRVKEVFDPLVDNELTGNETGGHDWVANYFVSIVIQTFR